MNYLTSNLAKAQAKLIQRFGSADKRFREPAVHKLFMRNSQIMFPDYESLRTREDRTVEAYYNEQVARALGAGRSHNHTGGKGVSGVLTPAWSTYNDVFSISLKQADNNVYSKEEMFMNEMENVIKNFMQGLETIASTYMFNNRSGVNVGTAEGTFNGVQDVFEIGSANIDRFLQIAITTMDVNSYQGMKYSVVADTVAWNRLNFQFNQGAGNSDNLSFQFGGVEIIHSPNMSALAGGLGVPYTQGFMCLVAEGMIGALPWIPKQNRMGVTTTEGSYGALMNPQDNAQYAIHSYEVAEDGTGTNGYTQDVLTQYEISLDMAYEHAPLSTVNETPIMAFGIV